MLMNIYELSLALGAAGLGIMGLSGFAHTLGGHHTGHAAPSSHAGHHAISVRAGARAIRGGGARGGTRLLWALLSPRTLFSLCLGFGVSGVVLQTVIGGSFLFAVAVLGALVFELGLMRPLWNFLFRFESAPALTLESCIGDEARAATSFDKQGHGLIALELNGQLVQLLGSLHREDRDAGIRVRAGDPVRIDEVDAERNRCTVRAV
jgi:hypothetical protein